MQDQIKIIEERNRRVELDKAWETSKTRRGIIAVATYVIATLWLMIIENEHPFLNAFVPTGGYLLSTLTLGFAKSAWVKKHD